MDGTETSSIVIRKYNHIKISIMQSTRQARNRRKKILKDFWVNWSGMQYHKHKFKAKISKDNVNGFGVCMKSYKRYVIHVKYVQKMCSTKT